MIALRHVAKKLKHIATLQHTITHTTSINVSNIFPRMASISSSSSICTATTRKGTQCSRKAVTGQTRCKGHMTAESPADTADIYTASALRDRFDGFIRSCREVIRFKETYGIRSVRMPIMDEDISENIIKFIINYKLGDKTCKWTKGIAKKHDKIPGDLISTTAGAIECKCFTSDGPISFGPTEKWNEIYFLDARATMENHFIIYRVPLSNSSDEWKSLNISKTQTFEDQCKQARRPRIIWESLYPQIESYASIVFEGSAEDIFALLDTSPTTTSESDLTTVAPGGE